MATDKQLAILKRLQQGDFKYHPKNWYEKNWFTTNN
jgi:alpha-L-fucosidase